MTGGAKPNWTSNGETARRVIVTGAWNRHEPMMLAERNPSRFGYRQPKRGLP